MHVQELSNVCSGVHLWDLTPLNASELRDIVNICHNCILIIGEYQGSAKEAVDTLKEDAQYSITTLPWSKSAQMVLVHKKYEDE